MAEGCSRDYADANDMTTVNITQQQVVVTPSETSVSVAITTTPLTVDVIGTPGSHGADGAAGVGVAAGGTTGQALRKASDADYDTAWDTLTASDVGADASGTAAAAIATHETVSDPHPQYQTQAEGDARYWPLTTDLATQAELNTHANNTNNPHSVTATQAGAEPDLGDPALDGYLLASTAAGVRSWVAPSTVGVTDHGALTGLTDDDHPQYARLAALSNTFSGTVAATALGAGGNPRFTSSTDATFLSVRDTDGVLPFPTGNNASFHGVDAVLVGTLPASSYTDRLIDGLNFTIDLGQNVAGGLSYISGINGNVFYEGGADIQSLVAGQLAAWNYGTNTIDRLGGLYVAANNYGGPGSMVTALYGIQIGANESDSPVGTQYGLLVRNQLGASAGTVYAIRTEGGETRHLAGDASVVPLVLQGAASQSANVTEWQAIDASLLGSVNAVGGATFKAHSAIGASAVIDADYYGDGWSQVLRLDDGTVTDLSMSLYSALGIVGTFEPTTAPTASIYLLNFESHVQGAEDFQLVEGIYGGSFHDGTGTINHLAGAELASINASTGSVNRAQPLYANIQNYGTGSITHATAVTAKIDAYADSPIGDAALFYGELTNEAGGLITTAYGLWLNATLAVAPTTWYGLYFANMGATNNYAIWTDGGHVRHKTGSAATVGMAVQRAASQSADVLQFLDSDGSTVLGHVDKDSVAYLPGLNVTRTVTEMPAGSFGFSAVYPIEANISTALVADSNDTNRVAALSFYAHNEDSVNPPDQLIGMFGDVEHNSLGTLDSLYGIQGLAYNFGDGVVNSVYGVYIDVGDYSAGGGNVGAIYRLYIEQDYGNAVANNYGIYVAPQKIHALYTAGGQVTHETGGAATIGVVVQAAASQTADILEALDSGSNILTRLNKGGYIMFRQHSAPANGDLATGECALWFDQTNGAAKLMIKAKQADGTVKTGSVSLA